MADTFATWQSIIADPNLTRKLATEVVVFEGGMIISGTYFGPKAEYDALGFEDRLSSSTSVSTVVLTDWLGIVANWAENEVLQLLGGVVS